MVCLHLNAGRTEIAFHGVPAGLGSPALRVSVFQLFLQATQLVPFPCKLLTLSCTEDSLIPLLLKLLERERGKGAESEGGERDWKHENTG